MSQKESRREDMGNGLLIVSEEENIFKFKTVPPIDTLTFTWSGGQSDNTYNALKNLFHSIKKDNNEYPQEKNINKNSCQSRSDDEHEGKNGLRGKIVLSDSADVKVTVISDDEIIFKNPNIGGMSKYTYETAKELILAMKKDNEERPQNNRELF